MLYIGHIIASNPFIHSNLYAFPPYTSPHYTRKIVQSYYFFFIYTNIFTFFFTKNIANKYFLSQIQCLTHKASVKEIPLRARTCTYVLLINKKKNNCRLHMSKISSTFAKYFEVCFFYLTIHL